MLRLWSARAAACRCCWPRVGDSSVQRVSQLDKGVMSAVGRRQCNDPAAALVSVTHRDTNQHCETVGGLQCRCYCRTKLRMRKKRVGRIAAATSPLRYMCGWAWTCELFTSHTDCTVHIGNCIATRSPQTFHCRTGPSSPSYRYPRSVLLNSVEQVEVYSNCLTNV